MWGKEALRKMREINVAIADDNERILDLLGEIISNDEELKLVGKANNGEDMYHLIKEKQPDVVLLQREAAGCRIIGSDHAKDGRFECNGDGEQ